MDKAFVPCNKYQFVFVPCNKYVFVLFVIETRPIQQVSLAEFGPPQLVSTLPSSQEEV